MNGLVGAVVLTKDSGFLGPIASILGWIMDLLFEFTSIFGIENIGLCIILFTLVTKVLICLLYTSYIPGRFLTASSPSRIWI